VGQRRVQLRERRGKKEPEDLKGSTGRRNGGAEYKEKESEERGEKKAVQTLKKAAGLESSTLSVKTARRRNGWGGSVEKERARETLRQREGGLKKKGTFSTKKLNRRGRSG